MSFVKLSKKELVRTGIEDFGVELNKAADKKSIIAELEGHGVTWDMYLKENPDQAEKYTVPDNVIRHTATTDEYLPDVHYPEPHALVNAEKAKEENLVLVYMTRENPLYEVRGYRFTKNNPYQLVREEDADHILLAEDGFRQATPREVKEFYS